jgi:hypothetical protein
VKLKTQSCMVLSAVLITLFLSQNGVAGGRSNRSPAAESQLQKLRNPRWSATGVDSQGLGLPKKIQAVSRSPARSSLGPVSLDRDQSEVPISFYGSLSRLK